MRKGRRQPDEPELYGASGAAKALGVTQTNLRTVAGLPEQYQKVEATTLYRKEEIDALAKTRKKRKKQQTDPKE